MMIAMSRDNSAQLGPYLLTSIALAASISFIFARKKKPASEELQVPAWMQDIALDPSYKKMIVREWEDINWRESNGWKGSDLIHGPNSAVRLLNYFWNESEKKLVGLAYFSEKAESHKGYCHGGAVCSLMDDVLGWTCFAAGKGPWCGCTAQCNVKLERPIPVCSFLKVIGTVVDVKENSAKKTKKVSINAVVIGENGEQYAAMEGISIEGISFNKDGSSSDLPRTWSGSHVLEA
uniref:Acyl-coenzyme A thioesterase THEM4 n=1 Tax=Fibrocapsa japonica TaxID=94617 RepID=A0A7S2V6S7_9STRA